MRNVLYELEGKSLDAAKELEALIADKLHESIPQQTGNLLEIQQSWQRFYNQLINDLSISCPDILKLTGLQSPCIHIVSEKNAYPRAYQSYPQIFSSPMNDGRYFIYCPIDYKDKHFVPEGAREIKDKEIGEIGDLLFAGGWLGNAPIVNRQEIGVEIPDDISYSTKFSAIVNSLKDERSTAIRKNFIPGGLSQELVDDFKKRKGDNQTACKAVFDELNRIAEIICPELKSKDSRYSVRLSASYAGSYGSGMTFNFSIGSTWDSSPAPLLENPYFNMKKIEGRNDYEVVPREDTMEGSTFADLLLSVPPMPYLHDYLELVSDFQFETTDIEKMVGVDGRLPQLVEIGGLQFISYNSDERVVSNYCPPGAQPVSTELYNWLSKDRSDYNTGIAPPPMPDELAKEYAALTLKESLHLKPGPNP